jgi:hypothetical protein
LDIRMVIKKEIKKVLLAFVTTSFILLVMVAPTTTTTATASLQQQEDNETSAAAVNATIDDPFIPIGPAEGEKEPDEPIPDNENETDDDNDDRITECRDIRNFPPGEDHILNKVCRLDDDNDDNDTISCKDIGYPFGGVDEYPDVPYCPGNNGYTYEKPETWINWVKGKSPDHGSYVKIRDGAVTTSHRFTVDFQSTATDTGKGSYVLFWIDKGPSKAVASPYPFTIPSPGKHTIYLKGVDKYRNGDPTPATFTIIIRKDKTYPPDDDYAETWINSVRTPAGKNIADGGSTASKVVTVDFQGTVSGPGSHIDLKIDNRKWVPVASPKAIPDLSVGKHTIYLRAVDQDGNVDPTPAKWTFTVQKGKDGYPDTWINWVRATPRGVNIADGGSTPSSTVIVDFQGTVGGRGSHIDLKIDSASYVPVASPHTITRLSEGAHTIYLRAVDQDGNVDPSPAQWRFTVINDNNNDD